jgi:hypothetical protein
MSLLIFTDQKAAQVGVVQCFKDPTYSIEYPCGPLLEMTLSEFRDRAYNLVLGHYDEYDRIRISQGEGQPVFTDTDERKYLKRQTPVMISRNTASGEVHLSPLYFRSYSLGGIRVHEKERCSVLPAGFSPEEFWKAFDDALQEAE